MQSYEIISLILRKVASHVRPGISTFTLNNLAVAEMEKYGAYSFNKGYKPEWSKTRFPTETCISVNNEIAHGIPSVEKILHEGDLVCIDMGIVKDGQCADAALTVPVGKIDNKDARLLQYTKKALYRAIEVVRPGCRIGEIADRIEETLGWANLVVNRQLTGHGIGKTMHEEPSIYHARNWLINNPEHFKQYQEYLDIELKEGQRICIEPMATFNDRFGKLSKNGWTFVTRDGKKSAMFEHMIEVTKDGAKILTSHID